MAMKLNMFMNMVMKKKQPMNQYTHTNATIQSSDQWMWTIFISVPGTKKPRDQYPWTVIIRQSLSVSSKIRDQATFAIQKYRINGHITVKQQKTVVFVIFDKSYINYVPLGTVQGFGSVVILTGSGSNLSGKSGSGSRHLCFENFPSI